MKSFNEVFEDKTKYGTKIKTSEYCEMGAHLIIDQGQEQVAGYTDIEEGVFEEVPVIIFGDHTRVIKYVDKPFFLGADGVKVLRSKFKNANYKYLYYALKNARIPNTGYNRHFKWLKEVQIEYPDYRRQENVVKILDKVSDLIETRQHEIKRLDDLIKARFVDLFGDMETNFMNWDTYNFGECFEIASSKRILKSEWKTEGIPFLRVRDMVQLATTKQMNNEFFVSEQLYSTLRDSDGVPKEGDILVSATSTLGKCYIVGVGERYYFKDADILRFRCKNEMNPIYFVELMKTSYIKRQIAKTLGVTTVAHFTIKAAKAINMRTPPIELQNQFAAFVAEVDKSKVAVQKALDETQTLFDSLMQEYFG